MEKDILGFQTENQELQRLLNTPLDTHGTVQFMNVGSVVDSSMMSPAARVVQAKYGPRATALITGPHCPSPIIGLDTPEGFIRYQERIRAYPISPIYVNFSNLRNGLPLQQIEESLKGRRLRPYITTPELLKQAREMGFSVTDWDAHNIDSLMTLNNKDQLHSLLRQPEIKSRLIREDLLPENTHIVPEPHLATKESLAQTVIEKLEEFNFLYQFLEPRIKQIFTDHQVPYKPHMAGVMVRPPWGGGNYESFYIQKQEETNCWTIRFDGHQQEDLSLDELTNLIEGIMETASSETYLITRFMQVAESPGHNIIVHDDFVYAAPPNGQVFEGSMCVGTSSFNQPPLQDGQYLYDGSRVDSDGRDNFLLQSRKIALELAEIIHEKKGRGIMGIDTMLTGFWEKAFAGLVQETEYAAEAVGPITIAEINVRPTQRTMHLLTQLAILNNINGSSNKPLTYNDLITGFEITGRSLHYTSRDSWPITPDQWKSLLQQESLLAGINGTMNGIYIIMPPVGNSQSMGVGIMAEDIATLYSYKNALKRLTINNNVS